MNILQIESIKLTRISVGAHAKFHDFVVQFTEETETGVLPAEDLFLSYKKEVDILFLAINRDGRLSNTSEISAKDGVRDKFLRQLFNFVRSVLLISPIEEEREMGEVLDSVLSRYHGIMRNEMHKETAEITALIKDLRAIDSDNLLKKANLNLIIDRIEQANLDLKKEVDVRVQEESKKIRVNARKQQKVVNEHYNRLVLYINAYAVANPNPEMDDFIRKINALIDEFKSVLSRTRSGNSKYGS